VEQQVNDLPDIIPVPGFNSDGDYVYSFCPYFNAHHMQCYPYIYGKAARTTLGNVIANRIRMGKVANGLIEHIDKHHKDVVIVCHSNGLALSYLAQKQCKNVVGVVSFNGALDSGLEFRKDCWVINCYHGGDWVLNLGKLRPGHLWGNYGKKPQSGTLVSNYNLKKHFDGFNPHSTFLKHLDDIVPEVIHMIKRRIGNKK